MRSIRTDATLKVLPVNIHGRVFSLTLLIAFVAEPASSVSIAGRCTQRAMIENRTTKTVIIENERGIGRTTLERPETGWTDELLFEVRTRGLESFVVSDSHLRCEISVNSSSHRVSAQVRSADSREVGAQGEVPSDQAVLQVSRRVLANDTHVTLGFRVEMATDWVSPEADSIQIQWIDFYR